jgi:hypothetical protein
MFDKACFADSFAFIMSADHLHFHGTLRSEVCLEDFLEALSGIDVDCESLGTPEKVGLGI